MRAPDEPASRADQDVLEIGGRLAEPPSDRLIATAFADELRGQRDLFEAVSLADMAHTLMMMGAAGPIPRDKGAALLKALIELHGRPEDFTLDPARGDLYTNREAWLNAHCAATGWLGVSRARREPVTCGFHMTVRRRLLSLADALCAFTEALSKTASRHRATPFPDYTYLQAAQPTTLGHYLLGFAFPAERHVERTLALFARVNVSPAGGGSANGSIAPQDRAALARMLGFDAPAANTRDAMWQADLSIEAAALIANILVTFDRLAEDLMVLTTQEFGLVRLSDKHSRASKIMPQKKNPFALAYVRAIANQAIGLQATTAASMRTPSGQMDNRMTAYSAIPSALRQAAEAAHLMAEVVRELEVDEARAAALLATGRLAASDLAENVMLATKLDFRTAHRVVGTLVRQLEAEERELATVTPADLDRAAREATGSPLVLDSDIIAQALDARRAVGARICIGGASPHRVDEGVNALTAKTAEQRRAIGKFAANIGRALHDLMDKARAAAATA